MAQDPPLPNHITRLSPPPSQEFQGLLLESINDAVIVVDTEHFTITYWNHAADLIYGWTAEEATGQRIDMLLSTRFLQGVSFADTLMSIARTGIWRGEVIQYHRDNNQLLIETTIRSLPDKQGHQIGLVYINRDVTERWQAQEALRTSEANLRAYFDGDQDAHFLLDTNYRLLEFNRVMQINAKRLWQRDVKAGESILEYVPSITQEDFKRHYQQCLAGSSSRYERKVTGTNGAVEWYEFSYSPVRNLMGEVIGVAYSAADITARKQAEELLWLRDRAMDAASTGIIIADAQHPDLPIIYANLAFERITGYSVAEAFGRNCRFLQGPDTDPVAIRQIKQAIEQEESCHVLIKNYRKDGSPFWNDLTIAPVRDHHNQITHFIGIQADVTERTMLEAQLRQSQKIESIGRMAGGIAHDFNNLLTAISGSISFSRDAISSDHPVHAELDEIEQVTNRAALLTRQLLAFARKQPIDPQMLNVNDLIRNLEQLLRRLISENIQFVTQFDPEITPVRADAGQIEQVLVNLAINARDAMPQGGQLKILTRCASIRNEDVLQIGDIIPGDYVVISFLDTGIGMAPDIQAHLFEPFFTTKGPGHGTGLGLATCYGIIKQHGGHIGFESAINQGTTFHIYLPAAAGLLEDQAIFQPRSDLPRGTETILLAEDDGSVRTFVGRVLGRLGYTVLDATNGQVALDLAQRRKDHPIHLLVTDVVMPEIGGAALADRLAAHYPGLKVLYISGYTDLPGRHLAPILQKPFTPLTLARFVRETLDS